MRRALLALVILSLLSAAVVEQLRSWQTKLEPAREP